MGVYHFITCNPFKTSSKGTYWCHQHGAISEVSFTQNSFVFAHTLDEEDIRIKKNSLISKDVTL